MKEENKYVTILKVLLFVSLVSLLTSAIVNLVIIAMSGYGDTWRGGIVSLFWNQTVMSTIFIAILLCFAVIYGLVLFSSGKVHFSFIMVFSIALIASLSSLILFVTTTMTSYTSSDYAFSIFTTFLAMYGTGFAISLLVTLLHFGDFLRFLRERQHKRIEKK